MSAFNVFLKDLDAVPDAVPVAVTIKPATAADGATVTAGLLRQFLPHADSQAYTGMWACPVGDPGSLVYPPPPWVRTNYLGAEYKLFTPNHPDGLSQLHTGDDLNLPGTADLGAPVRAIHDAEVIFAGDGGGTWLGVIVLKVSFDNTFVAVRYGHLTALHVQPGDTVKAGELIGLVGDPTGRAGFEPHLHFDIGKPGDSWLLNTPTDWPGMDKATIYAHYQDAKNFMWRCLNAIIPPIRPDPAGERLIVGPNGLNARAGETTASALVTTLAAGTRVRVNGDVPGGDHRWGQVTECPTHDQAVGYYVARDLLLPEVEVLYVQIPELNARASASLTAQVVKVFTRGAKVEVRKDVQIDAEGYRWRQQQDGSYVAQVALDGSWTALGPNKPALPIVGRWAGLHCIGDPQEPVWRMLEANAKAGTDVPLVVLVLAPGAAPRVKQRSPKTKVVVRPKWPDDYPRENGRVKFNQAWFNEYIAPVLPYLAWIDWVQFINERWAGNYATGQDLVDICNFYLALMAACEAIGTHCTVFDLPFGNLSDGRFPPEPDQFPIVKPVLVRAAQKGHLLMYHGYAGAPTPYDVKPGWDAWAGRWVYWLKRLYTETGLRLHVGLGEWGVPEVKDSSGQDAKIPSGSWMIGMLADHDRLVREAIARGDILAEQYEGECLFTCNPGERWKNFDADPIVALMSAYQQHG